MEWYYQYVTVEPMWESEGELAYRVLIPMLSKEQYLYFKLHYFDVPIGKGVLRKVKGQSRVAVNTQTGASFYPDDQRCFGHMPTVCRPIKEYKDAVCEMELVSSRPEPNCQIYLSDQENRTLDMFQISLYSEEIIILAYEPSNIITRCPGHTPTHLNVIGPVKVNLSTNCVLETSEWQLTGIDHGQSAVHLRQPIYRTLPKINFSWPEAIPAKVLRKLSHQQRMKVPLITLHDWEVPNDDFDWKGSSAIGIYVTLIVVLLIIVVFIVLVCMYKSVWFKKKKDVLNTLEAGNSKAVEDASGQVPSKAISEMRAE